MEEIIKKIFDLLTRQDKISLGLLFVGILFLAVVEMAGVASIMPFMAVVANPEAINNNGILRFLNKIAIIQNPDDLMFLLGVVVLCILVFSNIYKAIINRYVISFENELYYKISHRLLAKYLHRPYIFFLNRNTSDMGKNVLSEVRSVVVGLISPGVKALSSLLVSIFIMGLLFFIEPMVAVIIGVFIGGAYGLLYFKVRKRLGRIGKEQVYANTMKFKFASEALSGIKDLKILGREQTYLDKFFYYSEQHAMNNVIAATIAQVPKYFLEIMAFGGILLVVLYYLETGQDATKMIPLLALYAFAGYRMMPSLQQVFASFTMMRTSVAALDVLHADYFDSDPITFSQRHYDISEKLVVFQHFLELRNVSFRYPGMEENAVKDLSLRIEPNSTVGLVGTTGSGKTTIVDIILGLLHPTLGELVVDDTVISQDNIKGWQLNLGYVPQFIYLSDDTIARNIAFGVPDEEIDMEAVQRSARIANLDNFIENDLPSGYDTNIGERGVRLSGGQRQRIGIARALYRDPAVLILDEATSALDGLTESIVMEAIRSLSRQKTIIMIAHRLTTVKECDIIYLIENGEISSKGTYEELHSSSEWFRAVSKEDSGNVRINQ